ncbi:hypothetical protein QM467_18195 [Rhodoblastus sp. 17X3]|uniref:hypothetical protein n=1 Tax=Rhodoblastus sp. 17X3 TaxID=3047026 RepID=UPI0024B69BE2|nr:hypothetical protein [Rhodoblastus sp. 17X3]MDI9849974.1 hypothetical protein [Rhodoblastus sp. 17X3]
MTRNAPALASKSAREDVARLNRQYLYDCANLLESLGISLSEATWRSSDRETETLLRQLRHVLLQAIWVFKEITGSNPGEAK